MAHDDKYKAHIEALQRAGYVIKKRAAKTKTHTFVIDIELLKAFQLAAKQRNVSIRIALREAIELWLKE